MEEERQQIFTGNQVVAFEEYWKSDEIVENQIKI